MTYNDCLLSQQTDAGDLLWWITSLTSINDYRIIVSRWRLYYSIYLRLRKQQAMNDRYCSPAATLKPLNHRLWSGTAMHNWWWWRWRRWQFSVHSPTTITLQAVSHRLMAHCSVYEPYRHNNSTVQPVTNIYRPTGWANINCIIALILDWFLLFFVFFKARPHCLQCRAL